MLIISEQNVRLNISDALKSKDNVSLKIEAAHSGVLNGNFLFYLPYSLQSGATSLNQFYKPLQGKHYSKTLGYIYESEYQPTDETSDYYKSIVEFNSPQELISNVKKYIKTDYYKSNPTGFGVLISKAKLYDQRKIDDLSNNDVGTVSVAGDAGNAFCSICSKYIAKCGHKLGHRYKNEVCFGVVSGDFAVDHISFEAIPANWETNTLIIRDSISVGNIELIEEGQLMKLSLEQLKEKLGNIEAVLTELNLVEQLEQFKLDVSNALQSQFLLASDQLLPFNTPLTTFVTNSLLEQLEDSDNKQILLDLFGSTYKDIFDGKTEEEIKVLLTTEVTENVVLENEPPVEPEQTVIASTLSVADSNQIVLAIADSLSATVENSFSTLFEQLKELFAKEQVAKGNKILEDQVAAYKADLANSESANGLVTEQLKESLINQIILLKKVDVNSEYLTKLKTRSVQELKMTLEDHIQLATPSTVVVEPVVKTVVKTVVEPTVEDSGTKLAITDAQQVVSQVSPEVAVSAMNSPIDDTTLEISDSDKIVNEILAKVEKKINKNEYALLYKETVRTHGTTIAKKLHPALKAVQKI